MGLSIQYHHFGEVSDYERQDAIGLEIFNLMIPYAQHFDSRLLHWIPSEILDKFQIIYDSDDCHIKDWRCLEDGDYDSEEEGEQEDEEICSQSGIHNDCTSEEQPSVSNSYHRLGIHPSYSQSIGTGVLRHDGIQSTTQ